MSQEELKIHYRNRDELRKRIAMHGPGEAPLFLHSQLDAVEEIIRRREQELRLRPLDDLYQKGVQAMLNGQWVTAIKYLEQVIDRDPLYKITAELLEEAKLQQEAQERVRRERVIKVLRDPVFQGIGAIVTVLALLVAIGTWFWPDIRTLLFPTTSTATPTSTVTVTNLTEARVRFTITLSNGDELKVPAGGTLTLTPGEGVLVEMIITVGQSSFPRDLTYQYLAPGGSIPEELVGPRTSYVAPDQPGPDFITILITDPETGDEILHSINVVVKKKSP